MRRYKLKHASRLLPMSFLAYSSLRNRCVSSRRSGYLRSFFFSALAFLPATPIMSVWQGLDLKPPCVVMFASSSGASRGRRAPWLLQKPGKEPIIFCQPPLVTHASILLFLLSLVHHGKLSRSLPRRRRDSAKISRQRVDYGAATSSYCFTRQHVDRRTKT